LSAPKLEVRRTSSRRPSAGLQVARNEVAAELHKLDRILQPLKICGAFQSHDVEELVRWDQLSAVQALRIERRQLGCVRLPTTFSQSRSREPEEEATAEGA